MGRLIFIDATMREESRTRRIAGPLVSELAKRYEIETISLDGAGFPAVDSRILHDRDCGIVPVRKSAVHHYQRDGYTHRRPFGTGYPLSQGFGQPLGSWQPLCDFRREHGLQCAGYHREENRRCDRPRSGNMQDFLTGDYFRTF